VVFLIDNSPSVLIGDTTGDGTPDGPPTDEQDVRLRLTRFVVNVLGLDPTSASQRVGAISFAGSDPPTQTLMPLTPVRDWSKADFAAIREVDQGSGTDYAAALSAASEILFPPDASDCSLGDRRCDVVMVTDGVFDSIRRGRPAVEEILQDLDSRGVSVHVLTFETKDQNVWEGFLTNTLISTYQPSVTLASPSQVYDTMLRDLGAEALLAGLTPVEVSGEEIVPLKVPPFRTWTRYQILPDSPMTATFLHAGQVLTPVVAGTDYTFFQPPTGNWSMRLQGDGLAYYRHAGEGIADLSLYLRDLEEYLALGEDATIRAGLVAGGVPVTDLSLFTITATLSGTAGITDRVRLKPDEANDMFATTVPSTRFESDVYAVDVTAESDVPAVEVQPATGQFEVVVPPTLTITVTPTGPVQPGESVAVTVTVGNWNSGYMPELWLGRLDGSTLVTSLQPHLPGTFVAHVSHLTSATALVAQIPHLRNGSVAVAVLSPQARSYGGWEWGVLLSAVFVGLIFGVSLKRLSRGKSVRNIVRNPADSEAWESWRNFSIERDWPVISGLGEKFARAWRAKKAELRATGEDKNAGGEDKIALECLLNPRAWGKEHPWAELHKRLEIRHTGAIAILVYAGLRVSTVHLDFEGDPIPPLEVLEGMGLELSRGREGARFIDEFLDRSHCCQVFDSILSFFEEKDIADDDESLSIWKEYDVLIRYAGSHITERASGGGFVEKVEESCVKLAKRAKPIDERLARLLSLIGSEDLVYDEVCKDLESHPLLKEVHSRLGGEEKCQ
jgi:hypothetical protein